MMIATLATLLASAVSLQPPAPAQVPSPAPVFNTFDPALGWVRYDGDAARTLWRTFRGSSFPAAGWRTEDGQLARDKGERVGDLFSIASFADPELAALVRLGPRANSGIMFRCDESADAPWKTGPEYQLLDDHTYPAKPDDPHSCAALYDLVAPPPTKVLAPTGEWNPVRLRVRGGVVEHWLGGTRVVETRIFDDDGNPSPDWLARIASSKYKEYAGFGRLARGHFAIQDYGESVAFKDLYIRDLAASLPGEVRLFDGASLSGWQCVVPDAAKAGIRPEDVWRVDHGVLVCLGTPAGYIRTSATYKNFVLRLQWRWGPSATQGGNSGVLLRVVGEDKVWPTSIEAQLQHRSAGDFWCIGEYPMTTDPARTRGRNTKSLVMAERPLGEWNEYEILVRDGDVALFVNGQLANRAWNCKAQPGFIALQSEGAEIHFRDIRLAPLPD